jgi:hypothetical protein
MATSLRDALKVASREIRRFIDEISQDGAQVAEPRRMGRSLIKISLRLKLVDRCLAAISESSPQRIEAREEILKCKENLQALESALEGLRTALLARKSEIEKAQANLRAANAWAASLRQTSISRSVPQGRRTVLTGKEKARGQTYPPRQA